MVMGAIANLLADNASGELAKAFLTNVETGDRIEFLFNPTDYELKKTNQWDAVPVAGFDVPSSAFKGGNATTMTLKLFFDTLERDQDVRDYTGKIFDLVKISPETRQSRNSQRGRPPRCQFNWGKVFSFQAVITSFTVKYTLFKPDGTPVRANVDLSLQECEDDSYQAPQNPTSQGSWGHRVHRVQPGDTLDRLAYRYYGDSKVWREIADRNNLDNPRLMKPGQVLVIPTLNS